MCNPLCSVHPSLTWRSKKLQRTTIDTCFRKYKLVIARRCLCCDQCQIPKSSILRISPQFRRLFRLLFFNVTHLPYNWDWIRFHYITHLGQLWTHLEVPFQLIHIFSKPSHILSSQEGVNPGAKRFPLLDAAIQDWTQMLAKHDGI